MPCRTLLGGSPFRQGGSPFRHPGPGWSAAPWRAACRVAVEGGGLVAGAPERRDVLGLSGLGRADYVDRARGDHTVRDHGVYGQRVRRQRPSDLRDRQCHSFLTLFLVKMPRLKRSRISGSKAKLRRR